MKPFALILSVLFVPALAAPTGFVERGRYASGAAIVEPAAGGEYVYAAQMVNRRLRAPAVLTAAPARQAYVFFSAEEEQALLNYRDKQLASILKDRVVVARKRHYRATGKLDWPRVVVRADEVCVPDLASSDAADWRDHLVCHRPGALP